VRSAVLGARQVDDGAAAVLDVAAAFVDSHVGGRAVETDRLEAGKDFLPVLLDGGEHSVGAQSSRLREVSCCVCMTSRATAHPAIPTRRAQSRTAGIPLLRLPTSTCLMTGPLPCSTAATVMQRPSSACFDAPCSCFPSMAPLVAASAHPAFDGVVR